MTRVFFILMVVLGVMAMAGTSWAGDDTPLKLPRFASLGKDEIFVRTGPALQYPIKWVFKKRGLPVEIIREYDTWRQIRDSDGSTGWVHHAMLSGYRSAIVKDTDGIVLMKSKESTVPVVRLEKGVIAGVDECDKSFCKLRISGFKGWALQGSLWGVYGDEEIQ